MWPFGQDGVVTLYLVSALAVAIGFLYWAFLVSPQKDDELPPRRGTDEL